MKIKEGVLTFTFPEETEIVKYDDLSFYRSQLTQCFGGSKAMDILCIAHSSRRSWLIEVKDYRINRRTKPTDLSVEVAEKVRDTLAGLVAMQCNANKDEEKKFAKDFLRMKKLKVVLHLEQSKTNSKLFPRIVDPSKIQQKLKTLLKAVDAHPIVTDIKHTETNSLRFIWTTH